MTEQNQDLAVEIREQHENLRRLNAALRQAEQSLTAGNNQTAEARQAMNVEDFGAAVNYLEGADASLKKGFAWAVQSRDMVKKSTEARQKQGQAVDLVNQITVVSSEVCQMLSTVREKYNNLTELRELIRQAEIDGNWDSAVQYYDEALAIAPSDQGLRQGKQEAQEKRRALPKTSRALRRVPFACGLLPIGLVLIGLLFAAVWSFHAAFVPLPYLPLPSITIETLPSPNSPPATFTSLPPPTLVRPTATDTATPTPTQRPTSPPPVPQCGRLATATYPFQQPSRESRQYNRLDQGFVIEIVDVVERNEELWIVVPWPGGVDGGAFILAKFVQVLSADECADLLH